MIVRPAKKEGWLEVALSGMHMTAGPEENLWPYREPIPAQPGADSISQPGFFSTEWKSPEAVHRLDPFAGGDQASPSGATHDNQRWLSLMSGRQCLIAMQTHTPDALPESDSAARRVFFFLKIDKTEP